MAAMVVLLLISFVALCTINNNDNGNDKNKTQESTKTHRWLQQQLPDFMCSIFGSVLDNSLCRQDNDDGNSTGVECPVVRPLSNETGVFDLDRFTESTWYVQKQQITGFQYTPEDEFFCLSMTYTPRVDEPEFYHFENFGLVGGINGSVHQWDGENTDNWCAGQDEYGGGLLRVAPCVLRPLLAKVGFPLWIIAVADDYSWAIMSGGQPSEPVEPLVHVDGSVSSTSGNANNEQQQQQQQQQQPQTLCTPRTDVTDGILLDTGGSGLWLLTRERMVNSKVIAEMEDRLIEMGISPGKLFPVIQDGCSIYNHDNFTLPEEFENDGDF